MKNTLSILITIFALFLIAFTACSHAPVNPYEQASLETLKTFKTVSLPFGFGTHFTVSQGAFGKLSHQESGNEYSYDFDVPYGTPVLAVEDGRVIEVFEPKSATGCDPKFSETAHNIKIEAKDGTVAQYVHIRSAVHVKEAVHGGQVIAFTAQNGWLCQPHFTSAFMRLGRSFIIHPNAKPYRCSFLVCLQA